MHNSSDERRRSRCPICKAEAVDEFKPFCSKRCADIDLGKWFTGGYVVPGSPDDDEDGRATQSEMDKSSED